MHFNNKAPLDTSQVVDMRNMKPVSDTMLNPAVTDNYTRKAALALLMAKRYAGSPEMRARFLQQAKLYSGWQMPAGKRMPLPPGATINDA